MEVVAAPDKMRGTLNAPEFASAVARGAALAGANCSEAPISDGGEGFAELFGGDRIELEVEGPLGQPTVAGWFRMGDHAFVEMAEAAGRHLLPHPRGDDPVVATTRGVGRILLAARSAGATRITVGCGGSATTDGGAGCLEVVEAAGGLGDVELIGATDVTTRFLDAARIFGPQKGASAHQVTALTDRLRALASAWQRTRGIDVTHIDRTGAAGGFGGALVVLGATLQSGFDIVAEQHRLEARLASCDIAVTGEGRLDATTLEGKSIVSLLRLAPDGCRVLIITGQVADDAGSHLDPKGRLDLQVCDLSKRFGGEAARTRTAELVELVTAEVLAA